MNSTHDFESIINLPFQSDEKGDYPIESVILHLLKVSGFSYMEIVSNYSALKKESSLLRNKRGAVKCISKRINHAF